MEKYKKLEIYIHIEKYKINIKILKNDLIHLVYSPKSAHNMACNDIHIEIEASDAASVTFSNPSHNN